MDEPDLRLTFVCMGNICRSPTAHGVMRHKVQAAGLADRVVLSSAGTHAYHVGEPPDPRTLAHARRRGYEFGDLRARPLEVADFERSTLVLVMDWDNLALAETLCPNDRRSRLKRLTEFGRRFSVPVVPDPYIGGAAAFERVLDLVEDACDGLLDDVRRRLARTGVD
jgi:protein-tyrosine phosphatase